MRILEPLPGILAFYDGRIAGQRFADGPNWVDDGALSLGIASYALVSGSDALVYDTHISTRHAAAIRYALEARGVRRMRVVLSHWHLDHVAGNEVFADCEIIANTRTAEHLARKKAAIEAGTEDGPPAIRPLVLPTTTFEARTTISVGSRAVELIWADIHSDDGTVLWLPDTGTLLAGDTMEDTVTYVAEPDALERHLLHLDRLWELRPERILPNHGKDTVIQAGGYSKAFVRATQQYIRALLRCRDEPGHASRPLRELIAGPLDAGWVHYFEPYEAVHRRNLGMVLGPARLTEVGQGHAGEG
ncbi:MAG: MBL fold metallo-hydrolase [Hyphomicrobium sp.]|nr:MBL fold metallo-hydrolase [Hyphomicrobium sp.]